MRNPEIGDHMVVIFVGLAVVIIAVATVNYFLFFTGIGIGLLGLIGLLLQR